MLSHSLFFWPLLFATLVVLFCFSVTAIPIEISFGCSQSGTAGETFSDYEGPNIILRADWGAATNCAVTLKNAHFLGLKIGDGAGLASLTIINSSFNFIHIYDVALSSSAATPTTITMQNVSFFGTQTMTIAGDKKALLICPKIPQQIPSTPGGHLDVVLNKLNFTEYDASAPQLAAINGIYVVTHRLKVIDSTFFNVKRALRIGNILVPDGGEIIIRNNTVLRLSSAPEPADEDGVTTKTSVVEFGDVRFEAVSIDSDDFTTNVIRVEHNYIYQIQQGAHNKLRTLVDFREVNGPALNIVFRDNVVIHGRREVFDVYQMDVEPDGIVRFRHCTVAGVFVLNSELRGLRKSEIARESSSTFTAQNPHEMNLILAYNVTADGVINITGNTLEFSSDNEESTNIAGIFLGRLNYNSVQVLDPDGVTVSGHFTVADNNITLSSRKTTSLNCDKPVAAQLVAITSIGFLTCHTLVFTRNIVSTSMNATEDQPVPVLGISLHFFSYATIRDALVADSNHFFASGRSTIYQSLSLAAKVFDVPRVVIRNNEIESRIVVTPYEPTSPQCKLAAAQAVPASSVQGLLLGVLVRGTSAQFEVSGTRLTATAQFHPRTAVFLAYLEGVVPNAFLEDRVVELVNVTNNSLTVVEPPAPPPGGDPLPPLVANSAYIFLLGPVVATVVARIQSVVFENNSLTIAIDALASSCFGFFISDVAIDAAVVRGNNVTCRLPLAASVEYFSGAVVVPASVMLGQLTSTDCIAVFSVGPARAAVGDFNQVLNTRSLTSAEKVKQQPSLIADNNVRVLPARGRDANMAAVCSVLNVSTRLVTEFVLARNTLRAEAGVCDCVSIVTSSARVFLNATLLGNSVGGGGGDQLAFALIVSSPISTASPTVWIRAASNIVIAGGSGSDAASFSALRSRRLLVSGGRSGLDMSDFDGQVDATLPCNKFVGDHVLGMDTSFFDKMPSSTGRIALLSSPACIYATPTRNISVSASLSVGSRTVTYVAPPPFSRPAVAVINDALQGANMAFSALAAVSTPALSFSVARQQAMVDLFERAKTGNCQGISAPETDTVASADSPTQMQLGDSVGRYYVGAPVGNFILAASILAAAQIAGMIYLRQQKSSSWDKQYAVFARCQISMVLFVLVSLLMCPSLTMALIAVTVGEIPVLQRIVAMIFALVILAVTVYYTVWALFLRERKEKYKRLSSSSSSSSSHGSASDQQQPHQQQQQNILQRTYTFWFEGPGEWLMPQTIKGKRVAAGDHLDFDAALPQVDGFNDRAPWFSTVEFGVQVGLALAAFITQLVPAKVSCVTYAVVQAVVLGAYLFCCLFWRPFQERLLRVVTPVMTGCQLIVVIIVSAVAADGLPAWMDTLVVVVAALSGFIAFFTVIGAVSPLIAKAIRVLERWRAKRRQSGGGAATKSWSLSALLRDDEGMLGDAAEDEELTMSNRRSGGSSSHARRSASGADQHDRQRPRPSSRHDRHDDRRSSSSTRRPAPPPAESDRRRPPSSTTPSAGRSRSVGGRSDDPLQSASSTSRRHDGSRGAAAAAASSSRRRRFDDI